MVNKPLEQIQKEAREWSNRNFPDQIPAHSFFGVAEEVGELADCLLSEFPEDSEEFLLLRAIGNVGELAHRYLKKTQKIRNNGNDRTRQEYLNKIAMMSPAYREAMKKDSEGDILIFLLNYCSHQKHDLNKVLNETWESVRKRDWIHYPKNGLTE